MFGYRTPAKQTVNDTEPQGSPTKAATQTTSVRRSIGEWEAAKSDAPPVSPSTTKGKQSVLGPSRPKQKQTLPQEPKTITIRAPVETVISPPKPIKYQSKTAEARACLNKAKLHLSNSRNLKTDIKTEVTQAIDRLYNIVKELEEEKKGKGGKDIEKTEKTGTERKDTDKNDIIEKMEEHTKILLENSRKLDELKTVLEEQKGNLDRMTYARVAATKPNESLSDRSALHSIIVTSEKESDSGEAVLNKVREAIDAKEGWVRVTKVRKAKDSKIIMSCDTREEREKVKARLEKAGKQLIVEDIKNKDPLVILKDVLLINSDQDVIKALKNQNKAIFHGLDEEEQRVAIKYRRKARNPHTGHIVVSTSPKIWRRMIDAGALHIDLQHIGVSDQSPLVQCSRCLGYGHSKRFCKEAVDLCSHCGGPHLRTECADWLAGAAPNCRNCSKADLGHAEHNTFSNECPIRRKWDTLAREAVAYC